MKMADVTLRLRVDGIAVEDLAQAVTDTLMTASPGWLVDAQPVSATIGEREHRAHPSPFDELVQLIAIVTRLVARGHARGDWAAVYDEVFSAAVSLRIRELFLVQGVKLDYPDPDTTYQADVLAFAKAIDDHFQQLCRKLAA